MLFAVISGGIFAFLLSNSLVKTFRELSTSLGSSGDEVSSAASQIASVSEELSQANNEQAASLQETSSCSQTTHPKFNSNNRGNKVII